MFVIRTKKTKVCHPITKRSKYKLKKYSKKECCKQCRYVTFKSP